MRLLLCLALLASGCATLRDGEDAAPVDKAVKLTWLPKDTLSDVPASAMSVLAGQSLKVFPLVDRRPSPQVIGRNMEEKTPRAVTTKDDVGLFVGTQLAGLLHEVATPVVTEGETRVLTGEVAQYFVNEDNTYNATVVLRLTLLDSQERVLWRGVAAGRSRRWGRSFSAENYQEALSNALIDAVKGLVQDPAFLAAYARGA